MLLVRLEAGEHTFRPGSAQAAGEAFERLVAQLLSLRERGLVRLAEGRIMRNQQDRVLAVGPCDLTPGGREALEQDRRLGPRP